MQQNEKILKGLSAVQEGKNNSSIMGYLTWYSIGEDEYYRDILRQKLLACGIEESYLPNPIRATDAFRRATKVIETKRQADVNSPETYKNYIVRDVVSKGDKLQRNIVVETVNQSGERLDYEPEGAKLFFERKNEQFTFLAKDQMAEELADEAKRLYDIYLKVHNAAVIRASVVKYLNSMSPTPVRPSGGVYFVPVQYADKLRSLCCFVSSLEKGEGRMIPLVNDEDNRQMIKDKVKENLDKVLHQCRTAIHDENSKLTKAQVVQIVDEARRVVSQFKDYRELLEDTVVDLESSVSLVRQSISIVLTKGDK